MRRPRHPERQDGGEDDADRQRDEADRIPPVALLPVDHPEGEAADRERDDHGADPIELSGRLLVPAFGHVRVGGPERDQDQRDVDQEGRPPGDGVDQKATHHRAEDGGRPGGAGPDAEGAPLLLAAEIGGQQRQ